MGEVSPITRFAIRMGGATRHKLTVPGFGEDEFFFIIKPISGQQARMNMACAGLRLTKSEDEDEMDSSLNLWKQFCARADAQVVDFLVPAYKDDGTPLPSRTYSRSVGNNHEVYDALPGDTIKLLSTAMTLVDGDESGLSQDDKKAWEALGNEHSGLLTPLPRA